MNRLEDSEIPNMVSFPEDGTRAVDIPLTKVKINPASRRVEPKDGNVRYLTGKLNDSTFKAVRSMVIVSDYPFTLKGVYEGESNPSFEAGVVSLEGLPEITSEFTVDLNLGNIAGGEVVKPEEAIFAVYLFNTPYPQIEAQNIDLTVSKDVTGFSVDSDSYKKAMLLPGAAIEQERFKIENTGSNGFDARLSTIDAGETSEELEKTGIGPGNGAAFNALPSAQYYLVELKQNSTGSSTTADVIFRGES